MSKKLLYLLTLICSFSLFTACSDDDDEKKEEVDNSWEQVVGDYSGDKLAFSYGEMTLTGKEVKFSATSGANGSLLLKNVIPGENETTISNITVTKGEFSGTATTTNANVEYTGSVKDEVMTLKLTVVMNDPNGWAKTYSLADYTTGTVGGQEIVLTGGMYCNWVSEGNGGAVAPMLRTIGSLLMPQVLKTVTLETDGNITASYHKGSIVFDPDIIRGLMMGTPPPTAEEVQAMIPSEGWLDSPKNLAHWFVKDNKLYVKLNITAIISQVLGSDASGMSEIINSILQGDPATIKAMLSNFVPGLDLSSISDDTFEMLLNWTNNGIPMNVITEEGRTHMYLDKEALTPLMVDKTLDATQGMNADIIKLWNLLVAAKVIPQEASAAFMILLNFPQNWPVTTEFGLGLDFK
ncbi:MULTISPECIES: DUF4925 domain-containing protein [Parabacteroides]|uniref:DUF4925 domain-containing protein n=1 Tax=Parabacteroides leei TaxID=2939491 RepID=UPI001896C4B9|nr:MULTISPECIES: DUF4925 domain-containing protein [Parabacteroides]MCL3849860.1 DUF4925 domain-containing protein [Parabacteroides leei]